MKVSFNKAWGGPMFDTDSLIGETITDFEGDVIHFAHGRLVMYHEQDCCEDVEIEEVIGDPGDIVGATFVSFEEVSGPRPDPSPVNGYDADSWTWTFYKITTDRADVTIRWLGMSNGYYSESVDVTWIPKENTP